jgi:hypothetical protein
MQALKEKKWTVIYLAVSLILILTGYGMGAMNSFGGTLILLVIVVGVLPLFLTWLNLMVEQVRSKGFVQKMNGIIAEYQAKGQGPEALYERLSGLESEAGTDMGKAILNLNLAQTLVLLEEPEEARRRILISEACRYPNPVFRTELYKSKTEILNRLGRKAEAAKAYTQWEEYRRHTKK